MDWPVQSPDSSADQASKAAIDAPDLPVDAPDEAPKRAPAPGAQARAARARLGVGLLVSLLLSFALGVAVHARLASGARGVASGATRGAAPGAARPDATRDAVQDAIRFASTTIHLATLRDSSSPLARLKIAAELLADGRAWRAQALLEPVWASGQRDAPLARVYASALLEGGQASLARRAALDGLEVSPSDPALRQVFQRAIARDESLRVKRVTLEPDGEQLDTVHALGGGKSVSLRMSLKGRSVFAFKPAQAMWQEGWQSEIAAYTLCQILECRFHIPLNVHARIRREDLDALYDKVTSDKQTRYRQERFAELLWTREAGPDGQMGSYLHGTLKDWVPSFVSWPIEHVEHWRPWLDVTQPLEALQRAKLREALASLREVQGGRYYRDILRERETSEVFELAGQLSQLLAFDVVVSNWDRFSVVEAYYGVNNQFGQGRFISLDNGAAFHTQPMQRANEQMTHLTRFSKRQIAALRALEPGALDVILFPWQTEESKTRMKVFWGQREALLRHVDALIARHGAERVLVFP